MGSYPVVKEIKRWNAGEKPRRGTKQGVGAGCARRLRVDDGFKKADQEGHQQAHRFLNTAVRSGAGIEGWMAGEKMRTERRVRKRVGTVFEED